MCHDGPDGESADHLAQAVVAEKHAARADTAAHEEGETNPPDGVEHHQDERIGDECSSHAAPCCGVQREIKPFPDENMQHKDDDGCQGNAGDDIWQKNGFLMQMSQHQTRQCDDVGNGFHLAYLLLGIDVFVITPISLDKHHWQQEQNGGVDDVNAERHAFGESAEDAIRHTYGTEEQQPSYDATVNGDEQGVAHPAKKLGVI